MLQNDFFFFDVLKVDDKTAIARLRINSDHRIFEGHFPGQPVVPGVCMMQMVKEVLEDILATRLKLIRAGDLKFLAVINPKENNAIELELKFTPEGNEIKTEAKIYKETIVFFKFKGVFTK
jgi:3-hydroxyacyl-[acyl-carrier-protein] dehydratase